MKAPFLICLMVASYYYADVCEVGETLVASCNLPSKIDSTAAFCANGNLEIKYFLREMTALNSKLILT